ncbi:hypothetical protein [Micromonospora eburnea]|uniref:Uncharacterized protein n=1 Tax=Micromonospora eburnea TaxID=227316 RepID=A0A1C6TRV9_9ACTN|nr:hypothetical protein [Micromonospora eburnea]SCL44542.1 hypothetical protein GA0070604_0454 [Micromonospora eburnea]
MLPVAFAPSLWAATLRTLRKLTRVAVTALALVVGLNGLAAAPATVGPLRPVEVTGLRAASVAFDGLLVTAPDAAAAPIVRPTRAAGGASAAEVRLAAPAAEATAGQPRSASVSPVPGIPSRHADHDVAAPPATAVVVPAADPGRESIARRGPPRG